MEELRIWWVSDSMPLVGMTRLPGLTPASSAVSATDVLVAELERVSRYAQSIVILATPAQLEERGLSGTQMAELGARSGLLLVHRPVATAKPVPYWLMDEIASWQRHGPTLYADLSGHGRAATAAACALVQAGSTASDAIARVRAARGPKALGAAADVSNVHADRRGITDAESQGLGYSHGVLPSSKLRRAHLPFRRAPWQSHLNPFALTLHDSELPSDAPAAAEAFDRITAAFHVSATIPATLSVVEARAALYGLQRRWRLEAQDMDLDYDPGPTTDQIAAAWAIVEHLRSRLTLP